MRESRGWTLEDLADRTEMSRAYLSRLEAGNRQPSITALCAIAKAFGVSIATLFEHPDEKTNCVIIRGGSTENRTANGLTYQPLSSSTKRFNLHPLIVTVPAYRTGDEAYQHVGEEWVHVLTGRLAVRIGNEQHILEPGDSVHFDSRLPHRLDAQDGQDAKVLLVACSIPLTLNGQNDSGEMSERLEQFAGQFVG